MSAPCPQMATTNVQIPGEFQLPPASLGDSPQSISKWVQLDLFQSTACVIRFRSYESLSVPFHNGVCFLKLLTLPSTRPSVIQSWMFWIYRAIEGLQG